MKRLLPSRVCPACRRSFRGYTNECPTCRREGAENAAETASMLREQREGRRQETLDRAAPVPYGEFPEGF